MKKIKVIIVGAGPAGLTLGLSLQEKNIDFIIIESVSEDKLCADIGGGYDLGSNAIKIYEELGLGDSIKDKGTHFNKVKAFNRKGELANEISIPDQIELSSVRRSTLQNIILEKLTTKNMHFGSKVIDVVEKENEAIVVLSNGKMIRGDILVAADGVHSIVRQQVFNDGAAVHVGVNCMWGRLNWKDVPDVSKKKFESAGMMLGGGQSFIAGHIDGELVWTTFWQERHFCRSENKQSAKKKAIAKLSDWNKEVSEIVRLSNVDKVSEVGIYDRPPAGTWHSKRTILIGDAAHPMTPFLGAGANTAIADAFVLGHLIDQSSSLEDIFKSFERRRKTPLEKTVKTARTICEYSLSKRKWKNWMMLNGIGYLPDFLITKMMLSGDDVNDVSDIIERESGSSK